MKRIYIAGPIGPRDEGHAARITAGVDAGRRMLEAGFAVHVPHSWEASGVDVLALIGYQKALEMDEAWLVLCDAILRIPGHSPGADREVALADKLGIPVFFDEGLLLEWALR